jgi:hypothetical protein
MKSTALVFLSAAASVSAFPGMLPRDDIARQFITKRDASPASAPEANPNLIGTVGTVLGAVGNTVNGLLGSVAEGLLNPNDKRPEPGYEFKAPGPGDSRGPCPGLNLLANHGYLPRNGTVNFGQVVEATARGFNMGTDLATVLCTFAVLTDGDIATETWNLGAGIGAQKKVGGLNRHSTVEADVSPGREDFYNGCGDNHHLSSRIFKQNVEIVAESTSKQFDLDVMGRHFSLLSAFAKQYNPYIYYFPFPSIVSFAAFAFYPNFFSNGTYGLGGVANYESISSIIGAQYDPTTDNFIYVPERYPENWYRRSYPYGAVQALSEGILDIYLKNPIFMPVGQLGAPNLTATTLLCNVYQGLNSVTPLALAGTSEEIQAGITWALSKLDPFFSNTVLGCPTMTISENFLFPNANSPGGPLSPPPSVEANTGDNVYGKTYFAEEPTTPNCSPASG